MPKSNDKILLAPHPSLRLALNRHTKGSLLQLTERWLQSLKSEPQDENKNIEELVSSYKEFKKSGSKKKLIDKICDDLGGLTYLQLAQLDLKYCREHSKNRQWSALKLCWENNTSRREIKAITKLRWQMSNNMSLFFKHHLYIESHENSWWIRISINDGVAPNVVPPTGNIVYLVYFVDSEYLLSTRVKSEFKAYIMQALIKSFTCHEIEEWDLKGKYVDSLEQLLLHRESQGSFSLYRLNQVDDNPLLHPVKKKKPGDASGKTRRKRNSRIVSEDLKREAERERTLEENFGSVEQPALDHVEIKVKLPFDPSSSYEVGPDPITTTIRFEGTNVIEGIKKMIPLEIAKRPLPTFMSNLHSLAKNYLEVDENGIVAE
ncbi:2457_t:CDS:2 [Paraglomus brasilianum]|uniref:2457_t:CDS:1 n=1 Tax=Paraglomus brasilianum TaxID=144538 RepID=A0A9N9BWM6_9GLOM|nr:2457_t:CDS:2 [Paraglomus brasilianum]